MPARVFSSQTIDKMKEVFDNIFASEEDSTPVSLRGAQRRSNLGNNCEILRCAQNDTVGNIRMTWSASMRVVGCSSPWISRSRQGFTNIDYLILVDSDKTEPRFAAD